MAAAAALYNSGYHTCTDSVLHIAALGHGVGVGVGVGVGCWMCRYNYMPEQLPFNQLNPIYLEVYQSQGAQESSSESSSLKMKIHVKTMICPPTLALEVESSDTIGSVKAKIRDVPLHMQLLIFANQLLQDDRTLADYGIQDRTSIHLTVNLRG